jgi:hypothetical protein
MAKRILPYRDYSEHDVVNLFALDVSDAALSSYSKELTDFVEAEDGVLECRRLSFLCMRANYLVIYLTRVQLQLLQQISFRNI